MDNVLCFGVKKIHILIHHAFQLPRLLKYRLLSTNSVRERRGRIIQPVLFAGNGDILIEKTATLGFRPSPFLYSGYIHIEARNASSKIYIGNHVWMNNNCILISEGKGISIGDHSLLGTQVEIYDSDFHDLNPQQRMSGRAKTAPVNIGKNVFIGSNVRILKGVNIGNNSVVANSSIVFSDIPDNVIAAGNPARVIRAIN